jgi:hypothetical protein
LLPVLEGARLTFDRAVHCVSHAAHDRVPRFREGRLLYASGPAQCGYRTSICPTAALRHPPWDAVKRTLEVALPEPLPAHCALRGAPAFRVRPKSGGLTRVPEQSFKHRGIARGSAARQCEVFTKLCPSPPWADHLSLQKNHSNVPRDPIRTGALRYRYRVDGQARSCGKVKKTRAQNSRFLNRSGR